MSKTTQEPAGPVRNNVGMAVANIRLWFRSIVKRWWIIAVIAGIAGVIGYWMAYTQRPTYQSHLTFALDDGESGMSGAFSLAAEFGLAVGGSSNIFEGDNIQTLLSSRRIIERVLLSTDTVNGKAITVADYWTLINADTTKKQDPAKISPLQLRLSRVSFPVGQPRNRFSYLQDSVLKNIYKSFTTGGGLKVSKPDKKLNLFDVSVISYNERFSKVFTDRLIQEATKFYIEIRTRKSKETLDILEARVAQTRGSLNSAISSKAGFQDANVNPAFQQAQAQLQQKQIDISTYGGTYGELYKNLELARYEYLKDIPLLQIIDAADYPMERVQKGKIKTAVIYALIGGILVIIFLTLAHIIRSELSAEKDLVPGLPPGK